MCAYLYIHTYIHKYIYLSRLSAASMYVYGCMYPSIYGYIYQLYLCICVCLFIHKHIYIYTKIYVYIYLSIPSAASMYVYGSVYPSIYRCVYIKYTRPVDCEADSMQSHTICMYNISLDQCGALNNYINYIEMLPHVYFFVCIVIPSTISDNIRIGSDV